MATILKKYVLFALLLGCNTFIVSMDTLSDEVLTEILEQTFQDFIRESGSLTEVFKKVFEKMKSIGDKNLLGLSFDPLMLKRMARKYIEIHPGQAKEEFKKIVDQYLNLLGQKTKDSNTEQLINKRLKLITLFLNAGIFSVDSNLWKEMIRSGQADASLLELALAAARKAHLPKEIADFINLGGEEGDSPMVSSHFFSFLYYAINTYMLIENIMDLSSEEKQEKRNNQLAIIKLLIQYGANPHSKMSALRPESKNGTINYIQWVQNIKATVQSQDNSIYDQLIDVLENTQPLSPYDIEEDKEEEEKQS